MPGALLAGYKLQQAAIAPDKEMRGNPELMNFSVIGVGRGIELVGEQLDNAIAAILLWWQADIVYDYQRNLAIRRAIVLVGRFNKNRARDDAPVINM